MAPVTGLQGLSVRRLRDGFIEAWVSDAPRSLEPTAERVLEHEGVVDTALRTGQTPLPSRFGQIFDDDESCLRALREQASRIKAMLDETEGFVEMRTLLVGPAPSPAESTPSVADRYGPGRRFLENLRESQRRVLASREHLDALFAAIEAAAGRIQVRRRRREYGPKPGHGVMILLVPRKDVAKARDALSTIAAPGWRLITTGPYAPYSFCVVEKDDGTILAD